MTWLNQTHLGDCRQLMRAMIADGVKVQTIVTSPPYWGLRDYGVAGQFGSERTWIRHCARMRSVFRLCWELLADDGTLWLNYGDSYNAAGRVGHGTRIGRKQGTNRASANGDDSSRPSALDLKPKDLIGMPWRVAFTLQADGWYLRQDIIWAKPNPMPESVRDRCTKAHEYLFLFSKQERYYWDFEAMQEAVNGGAHARRGDGNGVGFGHGYDGPDKERTVTPNYKTPDGWDTSKGEGGHGSFHKDGREKGHVTPLSDYDGRLDEVGTPKDRERKAAGLIQSTRLGRGAGWRKLAAAGSGTKNNDSFEAALNDLPHIGAERKALRSDIESRHRSSIEGGQSLQAVPLGTRNRRSVWTVGSEPMSDAHFATFPTALIEPCILAGCPPNGIVFDPFMGSGTTARVATSLGRQFIGCELNPAYIKIQNKIGLQMGIQL